MDDKAKISAQVDADDKARWEEVGKEEYGSLSHLIRVAIDDELDDSEDEDNSLNGLDELTEARLSEIVDGIQQLQQQMTDMDARLRTVEQEVRIDPELEQIANEVFAALPDSREEVIEAVHQQGYTQEPIAPGDKARSGTIEALARSVNVPEHQVQQALDKLQADSSRVQAAELEGATRYWKEV